MLPKGLSSPQHQTCLFWGENKRLDSKRHHACRMALPLLLAIVAITLGGLTTYKKGWVAIKNLNLNINALMSVAVTGAVLIGQYPEAAMVMVLFSLAEAIEAKALDRARNAIKICSVSLLKKATVQGEDGVWAEIDIRQVALGSRIRVKPGERIASDGVIIQGQSAINQAPITGESMPVEKTTGDTVYAGTINESGSFEFQVTAGATNSTLCPHHPCGGGSTRKPCANSAFC